MHIPDCCKNAFGKRRPVSRISPRGKTPNTATQGLNFRGLNARAGLGVTTSPKRWLSL